MPQTLTHTREVTDIIRQEVIKVLREMLSDPDFGLELTAYAKKRLRQTMKSKGKGIPFSEIKKKYN